MKVFRISKWAFGAICILILLLPLSHHWKLLTRGERATGTVIRYAPRVVEDVWGKEKLWLASEITFKVDGVEYRAYGPQDLEYDTGRTMMVIYMPDDPSRNVVATFSGFYLSNYTVLPLILLIFWYAFYLSFNNYRKRIKMPDGKARRKLGN